MVEILQTIEEAYDSGKRDGIWSDLISRLDAVTQACSNGDLPQDTAEYNLDVRCLPLGCTATDAPCSLHSTDEQFKLVKLAAQSSKLAFNPPPSAVGPVERGAKSHPAPSYRQISSSRAIPPGEALRPCCVPTSGNVVPMSSANSVKSTASHFAAPPVFAPVEAVSDVATTSSDSAVTLASVHFGDIAPRAETEYIRSLLRLYVAHAEHPFG